MELYELFNQGKQMNTEHKRLKDLIQQLSNSNKQLRDTEPSSDSQKDQTDKQILDNQERKKRAELDKIELQKREKNNLKEDLTLFIKTNYGLLRKLGLIKSQAHYSYEVLGRCRTYFNTVITEDRTPPLSMLSRISDTITQYIQLYEVENVDLHIAHLLQEQLAKCNTLIGKYINQLMVR